MDRFIGQYIVKILLIFTLNRKIPRPWLCATGLCIQTTLDPVDSSRLKREHSETNFAYSKGKWKQGGLKHNIKIVQEI